MSPHRTRHALIDHVEPRTSGHAVTPPLPEPLAPAEPGPTSEAASTPAPARRRRRQAAEPEPVPVVMADGLLVAALFDQLQREENPWELLAQVTRAMDERKIGVSDRHPFYERFVLLVAGCPQAEEDALLQAGRDVFKYQLATAREDVTKQRGAGGPLRREAVSFENDELLADLIRAPEELQPVRLLLFYQADGRLDPVDELKAGSVLLYPPQSPLVDGAEPTLLLPSGAEEYGTEAALFEALGAFLDRVVAVPDPAFRTVASAFVLMTWASDRFDAVPYLRFLGDSGGGKSRGVKAVGHLACRGALVNGSVSAAALYRIIEQWKPVLCIDEADLRHSDATNDIIKVLNAGYEKGGHVIRCAGDDFQPTAYDTFGPKVIGTRERFADVAVESRCLTFDMPRGARLRPGIPLNFTAGRRAEAAALRNQCLLWRFRNLRRVAVDADHRLPGLDPRLNQIMLPLLAVAPHEAARATLLDFADRLGAAIHGERMAGLEARLLSVISGPTVRAEAARRGHWEVGDVTNRLNDEHPAAADHVGTRTVGRKLSHFGFTPGRNGAGRAIYHYSGKVLRERLTAYGMTPPRTAAE